MNEGFVRVLISHSNRCGAARFDFLGKLASPPAPNVVRHPSTQRNISRKMIAERYTKIKKLAPLPLPVSIVKRFVGCRINHHMYRKHPQIHLNKLVVSAMRLVAVAHRLVWGRSTTYKLVMTFWSI